MKQKHLTKKTVALFLIAGTICLTTGCNDTYDINKISGDMQLFENGLTAPVGNSTKFYLTEFIEENDILTVRDGKYAIHFEGNSPTTISIPEVKINPIAPTFEDASINFIESISMLPGMQEALDAYIEALDEESLEYGVKEILDNIENLKKNKSELFGKK